MYHSADVRDVMQNAKAGDQIERFILKRQDARGIGLDIRVGTIGKTFGWFKDSHLLCSFEYGRQFIAERTPHPKHVLKRGRRKMLEPVPPIQRMISIGSRLAIMGEFEISVLLILKPCVDLGR